MDKKKHLDKIRHSTAHLLAHAVVDIFPETLLTIGPATKDGFFYDFLPKKNFKKESLSKIEEHMHALAKKNLQIKQKEISKEEAKKLYKNNPFKLELIEEIEEDTVGLSTQGDFYDLCKGGHVDSTGDLKYFKLTSIAGSYWRGDKENTQLQRIIGVAFTTKEELDEFEKNKAEALLYDHKNLGKQLDMFSFHAEAPGMPFFHPKGMVVINILKDYMRKLLIQHDYKEISTPEILKEDLWKKSGHYDYYKENMYFCKAKNTRMALKPMSCPGAMILYRNKPKSYRELPLRLSEFGKVHRYELSGVLQSLLRARGFTQDDAHIFCTANQIEQEVTRVLDLIRIILKDFNLTKANFALATKPKKAMGSDDIWEKAMEALAKSMEKSGIKYQIEAGEAAFYGPKIEVIVTDVFERAWTCGTIQVDFLGPENFDLSYTDSSGKKKRPVMIHHAIFGSLERFFAILLENNKGKLPLWLAPVQTRIAPISIEQLDYAKSVLEKLKNKNIRAELDESNDNLSSIIKRNQIKKIPCTIIIGHKEADSQSVTIRYLNGKQEKITTQKLIDKTAAAWKSYNYIPPV